MSKARLIERQDRWASILTKKLGLSSSKSTRHSDEAEAFLAEASELPRDAVDSSKGTTSSSGKPKGGK